MREKMEGFSGPFKKIQGPKKCDNKQKSLFNTSQIKKKKTNKPERELHRNKFQI